ncbi:MAG: alkaline phosphatase family protein [Solirubrobacteraceae bacterium]|nr:MAG: phosphoesterase [Solirubrobacterales bacterium]
MIALLRTWALLAGGLAGLTLPASPAQAAPPIKHVFIVMLENENAATSFGSSSASPYLARTLPAMGAYVPNYYGTGHVSLDNYVTMVSGQAPNPITQTDCLFYANVVPGVIGPNDQAIGQGCVYPSQVQTIGDQLQVLALPWRGYMESMGANPARESATCGHPALNSQDHTQSATATDQYASRHDPFVYFHSVIDDQVSCDQHVVNLDRLPADLASEQTTPSYSFISPSLCNDGHDATCANGGPGGLKAIDGFLSAWVPRIVASPAFRDGGLLVVTFDESANDNSSCCGEPAGLNTPLAGLGGPGGGKVGAVLVSPYIRGGTVTQTPYNHYSLLRSVEDYFGVAHLGYAAASDLASFGADVFTAPAGDGLPPAPVAGSGPGSGPGCHQLTVGKRRGRLPRGSVLRLVRVVGRARRSHLQLAIGHGATLSLRIDARAGRVVRRTLRLAGCRRYSIALPAGHGRVLLRARVGRASETRTVRY